jgi:hypothetical protein
MVGALRETLVREGDYAVTYNEQGTRVCIVASEPVTSSASNWAEVPRNTALVVCHEKGKVLSVMQSPLAAAGLHSRQDEVHRCLEAVVRVPAAATPRFSPQQAKQFQQRQQHQCHHFHPHQGSSSGCGIGGLLLLHGSASMPAGLLLHGSASMPAGLLSSQHSQDLEAEASLALRPVSADGFRLPPSPRPLPPSPNAFFPFARPAAPGGGDLDAGLQENEEHELTGHTGTITTLAVSKGRLFSGSTDCTIKVPGLAGSLTLTLTLTNPNPNYFVSLSGAHGPTTHICRPVTPSSSARQMHIPPPPSSCRAGVGPERLHLHRHPGSPP